MITGNLDKKVSKVHSPPPPKDQDLQKKRGHSPDTENDPPKQPKLGNDTFEPPSHRHKSTPTSARSFTKIKSPEKQIVTTPTQTIIDDEETSPKKEVVQSKLSRYVPS